MSFNNHNSCIGTCFITLLMAGCTVASGTDSADGYTPIAGRAGTPRFNLQYSNGQANDVDLYVKTPGGQVICYRNPAAQHGKMDLDCLCGDKGPGGNENIYWLPGTAPKGRYMVWAQYFDPCVGTGGSAKYVIRIMDGQDILQTYTGRVSTRQRKSLVYSFNYR